jgi:hypothetical protein
MQFGVLAYLVKPFSRDAIMNALNIALAWHQDMRNHGPQPDDLIERLEFWLSSLDRL